MYLFEGAPEENLNSESQISLNKFLKLMREYIGDVNLLSEGDEQVAEQSIKRAVNGKLEYIYEKCQKHETQQGIISKKTFLKSGIFGPISAVGIRCGRLQRKHYEARKALCGSFGQT